MAGFELSINGGFELSTEERQMSTQDVEQRDGAYMISGSRVSLDSIIHASYLGRDCREHCPGVPCPQSGASLTAPITYDLAHRY